MKKKLILELLVADRAPKVGDLVLHPEDGLGTIHSCETQVVTIQMKDERLMTDRFQVVEPYGLTSDPIQKGDNYFANQAMRTCIATRFGQYPYQDEKGHWDHFSWKKVAVKPEQFNYRQLVDYQLKQHDVFSVAVDTYNGQILKQEGDKVVVVDTDYNYEMHPMNPNPALPNWMQGGKPSYSEEEVKALFEKLVNDFPLHRGLQLANELPAWFEQNRKQ